MSEKRVYRASDLVRRDLYEAPNNDDLWCYCGAVFGDDRLDRSGRTNRKAKRVRRSFYPDVSECGATIYRMRDSKYDRV